jgi:sortase A
MLSKALTILLCILIPIFIDIPSSHSDELIIPKINLNERIYKGYSLSLMDRGVVIDPDSLKTNNWVIYGHRFSKRNPLKKYLRDLGKLEHGDTVFVRLNKEEFEFEVEEKLVVDPSQIWVTAPTQTPTLTIVTCTPIERPVMRLIIIAKLVSIR